MDFDGLKAFLAVAKAGSFSQAAERLYLTQPAVSKRIAALEGELGVRLFDRIGRRIDLTEAGRALLPKAAQLLDQAADLRRTVDNLSSEVSGVLSMATSHHIGLHRLPPVLGEFIGRYPQVQLDLRFMDSEQACRRVEAGELELAVVTLPREPSVNLLVESIWRDSLQIAVGPSHPLARLDQVDLAELCRHPAVLPGANTYTRAILEREIERAGLALNVGMTTNYLETLKMLVTVGMGWSLLPAVMCDDKVRVVAMAGLVLSRDLGLVRHRQRTASRAGLALQDLLLAHRGQ